MAAGALLVAVAVGILIYNVWDSERAEREAADVLSQLDAVISDAQARGSQTQVGSSGAGGASGGGTGRVVWQLDREMPTAQIGGREYIARLYIPSLGLALPVAVGWDEEALRVSPCRYSGSYYTDDLVVCGYNYDSQFGPLLEVAPGSDIYVTTVDGLTIHYVVVNRETLRATAIDQMVSNSSNSSTSADWDLTLFTCDVGGSTRCAVRCARV